MSRGGRRDGAGRKPGSANVRTREIADQAAAGGDPLPLGWREKQSGGWISFIAWSPGLLVATPSGPVAAVRGPSMLLLC
jgi:hypothetical protein